MNQKATRGHRCLVDGCDKTHPSFMICTPHWNKLPISLKKRWWDETNYRAIDPNSELIAEINGALK